MAALGEFTVVIDGTRLGEGTEAAVQVQVKFSDGRQFIKDADGDKIIFPHESARQPVSPSLPYEVNLKTDVASGAGVNSEVVGYEIVVTVPKTGGRVSSGPFAARPAGTTVNLADIVSDWTGLITEALAVRAETAAADAETAAASVQREQASGVAGLTSAGKLYEARIPDRLSDASLSATYASVGQTMVNVSAYGDDLAAAYAAEGGGKVYHLTKPEATVSATIAIGDHTHIVGTGRGTTTLKLAGGTNTHMLTNADQVAGNVGIHLRGFTLDGNKANNTDTIDPMAPKYGMHLHRCSALTLDDIEAKNVRGTGIFLTGDATQTRVVHLSNVYAHDNDLDGVWVGNAMREVHYDGVFGRLNARHGVVIDHSEAIASAVDGYGNGEWGVWVRNVHGCTLNGLRGTFNGKHGIYVLGLTQSIGGTWYAANNGQATTGQADVYFDGGSTTPGYGPSDASQILGITAGYNPNWPSAKKTDYCVYFADALGAYDLKVYGVNNAFGALVQDVRVPASSTKLYVEGVGTGVNTKRVWSGTPAPAQALPQRFRTVSSTYTIVDATDDIVMAQGAFTVTLPGPGAVAAGRRFTVKNGNTTTGNITVATTGSPGKTIDGATTVTLTPLQKVTVVSDGSQWWTI